MSFSPAEKSEAALAAGGSGQPRLLTVNGGSSSLKFAVFDGQSHVAPSHQLTRLGSGRIEKIGLADSQMILAGTPPDANETRPVQAPDLAAGAELLVEWLEKKSYAETLAAVGFRIVHGGPRYHRPERITADLVAELRRITPLDVDHLPGQIALIECLQARLPGLLHVACFDTSFHHDLPRVAQLVPIPRRFESAGVRRYGFHGLSYTFLMEELARIAGDDAARGRIILAHLGAGASLAAVRDGRPIDTTMGLTPASGLVMATRSGDIDPGLPFFLSQRFGKTVEQFHALTNHESGLRGVSETSSDFRDLLARRKDDMRAAEAVALFAYQARKWIGALAAALGGLDLLVFSGGIGENSPEARAMICEGLDFLGITLDASRNQEGAPVISADSARTPVRVIRTDEELTIARATASMLAGHSKA